MDRKTSPRNSIIIPSTVAATLVTVALTWSAYHSHSQFQEALHKNQLAAAKHRVKGEIHQSKYALRNFGSRIQNNSELSMSLDTEDFQKAQEIVEAQKKHTTIRIHNIMAFDFEADYAADLVGKLDKKVLFQLVRRVKQCRSKPIRSCSTSLHTKKYGLLLAEITPITENGDLAGYIVAAVKQPLEALGSSQSSDIRIGYIAKGEGIKAETKQMERLLQSLVTKRGNTTQKGLAEFSLKEHQSQVRVVIQNLKEPPSIFSTWTFWSSLIPGLMILIGMFVILSWQEKYIASPRRDLDNLLGAINEGQEPTIPKDDHSFDYTTIFQKIDFLVKGWQSRITTAESNEANAKDQVARVKDLAHLDSEDFRFIIDHISQLGAETLDSLNEVKSGKMDTLEFSKALCYFGSTAISYASNFRLERIKSAARNALQKGQKLGSAGASINVSDCEDAIYKTIYELDYYLAVRESILGLDTEATTTLNLSELHKSWLETLALHPSNHHLMTQAVEAIGQSCLKDYRQELTSLAKTLADENKKTIESITFDGPSHYLTHQQVNLLRGFTINCLEFVIAECLPRGLGRNISINSKVTSGFQVKIEINHKFLRHEELEREAKKQNLDSYEKDSQQLFTNPSIVRTFLHSLSIERDRLKSQDGDLDVEFAQDYTRITASLNETTKEQNQQPRQLVWACSSNRPEVQSIKQKLEAKGHQVVFDATNNSLRDLTNSKPLLFVTDSLFVKKNKNYLGKMNLRKNLVVFLAQDTSKGEAVLFKILRNQPGAVMINSNPDVTTSFLLPQLTSTGEVSLAKPA